MKRIVAIVGRPNVGKSTLFNRMVAGQTAIVEREPGVTRDRIYADAEWAGREFAVVDTGGLEGGGDDTFAPLIAEQARAAIDECDLVIFLVDSRAGLVPGDDTIGQMLRRMRKPIVVAANKAETPQLDETSREFLKLGLGEPLPISAAHGLGIGELLDAVTAALPPDVEEAEPAAERGPVVAVIGRPNVGKSSLVNALVGSQRMITSEVPGTTRDAIDITIRPDGRPLTLIDTAGLRRPSRVEEGLERFSVMRTLRSVSRCDIVWLLVDVEQGVSEQERRIAGYVAESGRGLVIVLNKIDLLDRAAGELLEMQDRTRRDLYFLGWAPLVSVSARTGEHLHRLLRTAFEVIDSRSQRVPRGDLEGLLRDAVMLRPPGTYRGRQIRFLGAEQLPGLPPAFAVYFDRPALIGGSYLRYIENRLRDVYSFTGAPLRVLARGLPRRKQAAGPTRRRAEGQQD
jgi:GTP-binding protein